MPTKPEPWYLTSGFFYLCTMIVVLGGTLLCRWYFGVTECAEVCEANGHGDRWTWTQGCFCEQPEGGLYNPADSRER
jgi:hypothetical protein